MVPKVVDMTNDEARARRAEVIRLAGGDEDAFRARAAEYLLSAEELALYSELESLDFLLGE